MENPRPEKVAVVDEVRERFESTSAALLTEYRGLDVTAIGALRRALRDAGGEYKIYKNTLVRLAVREAGLDIEDLLVGPTAIAFVGERQAEAGIHALPVDVHRAGPALPVVAPLLRAGQVQRFAKCVEHRAAWIDVHLVPDAVDRERHIHKPFCRRGPRGFHLRLLGERSTHRHGSSDQSGGPKL